MIMCLIEEQSYETCGVSKWIIWHLVSFSGSDMPSDNFSADYNNSSESCPLKKYIRSNQ